MTGENTTIQNRFTKEEQDLISYISGNYDLWAFTDSPTEDVGQLVHNAFSDLLIGTSYEAKQVIAGCHPSEDLQFACQKKLTRMTEGDYRDLLKWLDAQ
jgi:hypothetical protein